MYVQVNFGRNIDNKPMSVHNWMRFELAVMDALFSAANSAPLTDFNTTVEVHSGVGNWFDETLDMYVREESKHVSYFDPAGFDLDLLKNQLALIKVQFNQDAIAVIVGSELV